MSGIPQPDSVPGDFTHASRSFSFTSTFVISGYLESRQAIAPDMTGVAMEVPVFIIYGGSPAAPYPALQLPDPPGYPAPPR